ncbi:hypothetical protein ACGF8B_01225 [Streptomyces sp. NPDC047917]|uniref:hypothetical protein n=1 Tax=Streptomyces sp. NPDC047917 TaxID=3365491 RepID=UPI0037220D46
MGVLDATGAIGDAGFASCSAGTAFVATVRTALTGKYADMAGLPRSVLGLAAGPPAAGGWQQVRGRVSHQGANRCSDLVRASADAQKAPEPPDDLEQGYVVGRV